MSGPSSTVIMPPTPKRLAGSTTKSLLANRDATRSGAKSPRNSGTTGAGSRRTPSGRFGSFAICSPSRRGTRSHRSARSRVQARDPALLLLPHQPGRSATIRFGGNRSPRRWKRRTPSGYELEDPLEEDKDSPVPGLTHRYPDRCLLVTTHVCTMYCRFCTRKRTTMVRGGWDAISRNDDAWSNTSATHPEIRDVIVSGGDPLTLPTGQAEFLPGQPGDDPACRRHPHRHPRAGRRCRTSCTIRN